MILEKAVDPVQRIERMIAAAERDLREAFLRTIARVRSSATLDQLGALLEAGRIEEAIALGQEAYQQFADSWNEVYVSAGSDTAGFIGRQLDVIAAFDVVNERAVQAMQANRLRMVRELTRTQSEAARSAILEGIESGMNPRQQARLFRDSIGLTAKQQKMVANFRRELEELSARALSRKLRDRRFDRTIQRALDSGSPLTGAQVSKMTGRYQERMLAFRSNTIARTESLRSVHQGSEEAFSQAIDSGQVRADSVMRVWNTARDDRVRDFNSSSTSHRTMHGQQRRMGEPFTSGAGNSLMFPGDPGAPAVDTVQCRCVVSMRFQGL